MNIGQKIQEVLKEQNKTLSELAEISGISEKLLYKIINRKVNSISIDAIIKITNALNISPTELLGVAIIKKVGIEAFSYDRNLKLLIHRFRTEMKEVLMYLDYIEYKRKKLLNM